LDALDKVAIPNTFSKKKGKHGEGKKDKEMARQKNGEEVRVREGALQRLGFA